MNTGDIFGRLTVMSFRSHGHGAARRNYARCRCSCGVEKDVCLGNLRNGDTKSCGCLRLESSKRTDNKFIKHGQHSSGAYASWAAMRRRCGLTGKKWHRDRACYADRGISVCDRWSIFENFFEDMGYRPMGKPLDRIDPERGYSKDNCRWASSKEQASNKRNTRWLTVDGETKTLDEWSALTGVGRSTIRERLRRGWTNEDAVMTSPLRKGLEFLTADRAAKARRVWSAP